MEVTDSGPRSAMLPAAAPSGHGIPGMRKRAAAYGGTPCTAGDTHHERSAWAQVFSQRAPERSVSRDIREVVTDPDG
ncbi:hypothetical protein ACIRSU_02955 [Streptomyces sp. NPDC101160]|uniref:hypothetical protein n=1 Tax=Streptomyces sp. NPDC101160 TaxID=3366118 RepID=UPI00382FDB72